MDPRALRENIRGLNDFHIRTRVDERDISQDEVVEVFFGNQKEFEALLSLGNFVEVAAPVQGKPPVIPVVGTQQQQASIKKMPDYLAAATKYAQDQAAQSGLVEGAQRCDGCNVDMAFTGNVEDGAGGVIGRSFCCPVCTGEKNVPISVHPKAAGTAKVSPEPQIPPLVEEDEGNVGAGDATKTEPGDDTQPAGGDSSGSDPGSANIPERRSIDDTP